MYLIAFIFLIVKFRRRNNIKRLVGASLFRNILDKIMFEFQRKPKDLEMLDKYVWLFVCLYKCITEYAKNEGKSPEVKGEEESENRNNSNTGQLLWQVFVLLVYQFAR